MMKLGVFALVGLRVVLAGSILVSPAGCQGKSGGDTSKDDRKTEDGFSQLLSNEPVNLGVPLRPIRPAQKSTALPDAPNVRYSGTLRRFINTELNSRTTTDIPVSTWNVEWQTAIPSSFEPAAVLEVNGSIIVQTKALWFLFDGKGKKIDHGELGASGIVLDAENFYAADSDGMILGRKLSDGASNFALPLIFGDQFARSFILRIGTQMIVVSRERELDPHRSDRKEQSLVELVNLGERMEVDRDGVLTSAKAIRHLARKSNTLLAASAGEKLILATRNRFYTTDLDLKFTQALTEEFMPTAMSVDEAGRIYTVIERSGRRFFWIISTAGERISEYELPAAFGRTTSPPVIGYDHVTYLSAGDEILAVGPTGRLVWSAKLTANIAGMVITPNQKLLVSAGRELLAFDADGNKRVLFRFGDQSVSTAPTVAADGSILIASENHLIKLISRAPR